MLITYLKNLKSNGEIILAGPSVTKPLFQGQKHYAWVGWGQGWI
jgi:hypothetical protein